MMSSFRKSLIAIAMAVACTTSVSAQEVVAAPVAGLPSQGPAASRGMMSPLTVPQFTRLTPAGSLLGTISRPAADGSLRSIPNLEVSLITGGRIVARVATNPDGDFVFASLRPGHYTIVASNPEDLVVFPLTVAPNDGAEVDPILLVTASPIAPPRRQAMLAAVLAGPMGVPAVPNAGLVEDREVLGTYEITIAPTGELVGRVGELGVPYSGTDMSRMIVRLIRENTILGEAIVEADGRFAIPGVSPGPAGFFAFGPNGFIAIGVNLVPATAISANQTGAGETLVSMQAGAADLNVEVSPMSDIVAGVGVPGDSFSGPIPPGGAGGAFGGPGGGFGGGGAGGGGGLGGPGLMGLGAAALAAAALSSEDDGNNFVPQAASPN